MQAARTRLIFKAGLLGLCYTLFRRAKSIRGGASSPFGGPLREGRDARTPPAETGEARHLCGRSAARCAWEMNKKPVVNS